MASPDSSILSSPNAPPVRSVGRSLFANLPVPIALGMAVLLGLFVFNHDNLSSYGYEIVMQAGLAVLMAVSLQVINGYSGQFSLGHAGFMAIGAYLSGYPSVQFSQKLTDPCAVLAFFLSLFVCLGIAATVLYVIFMVIRAARKVHPLLPLPLLVLGVAWFVWDISQSAKQPHPQGYLVISRSIGLLQSLYNWMLTWGVPLGTGCSKAIPAGLRQPICFLILLVGGGLCAAAAGLIVGLPTLRLSGDYLAIATLGFAEIIRIIIQNTPPLGGPLGMLNIPSYTDFAWLWGAAVITAIVVWRLAYSARGRAIQAVREDEIAAAAVGVSPTKQKVQAFVFGAFLAGVGGVLYAHYFSFISPTDFGFQQSIDYVVMVVLGGLGSVSGAVLSAIVLTLLLQLLRNVDEYLPASLARSGFHLADYRMVLYALLLIAMMLIRPQGLLGGREIWPKSWGRRRRITSPVAKPSTSAMPGPTPQVEGGQS